MLGWYLNLGGSELFLALRILDRPELDKLPDRRAGVRLVHSPRLTVYIESDQHVLPKSRQSKDSLLPVAGPDRKFPLLSLFSNRRGRRHICVDW